MPEGSTTRGFGSVADELEKILGEGEEAGLAVAAEVDGERVVDLWGGDADPGQPWAEETLATVFSVTKGAAALCAQVLWDRGLLDIDAPIAHYWPEFAVNGKDRALVWHALSHTLGIPVIPGFEDLMEAGGHELADHDALAARIAGAPLDWEPGTKATYHALSYGVIVGELVRRITGRSLGTFFREEIAEPFDISFWIGLPTELHHRVTDIRPGPRIEDTPGIPEDAARVLRPYQILFEVLSQPWMRVAELPAGGGIGDARGLARMYTALATDGSIDGRPLVSPRSIETFSAVRFEGVQEIGGGPFRQALGYHRFQPEARSFGLSDAAFGHGGAGGSMALADPTHRLSFALVKNQMTVMPTAVMRLLAKIYACLDSARSGQTTG